MKKHGLGAMLCMYDENVRYLTGTLTPGWNRLKPGLRYALLCGDGAPVLFEQGDLGFQIERHSPWIPKENVRYSYAWIKGAAGPASQQQVKKFTDAIMYEMKRHGVAGQKLGVDFIDINMISIFKEKKINWVDGMTPMMEARAVKNVDEQECMRIVGAIGDATHWECMKFLRPGITENQVTAHLMKYLYSIPGHGGRRGRDRLLRPQYLAELAQFLRPHHSARRHRVHGFGRAHLERLQVLLLPHLLRRQGADARSRRTPTPPRSNGFTTRSARSKPAPPRAKSRKKWPSAKEAWGYKEEDQAAANLWGHGLGLAQYDPPVISRIWSLDHPVEIKAGMTFALETQHGKRFRYGVRIEEMLIVHKNEIEIISNFPVKQITVVDPIPGYGDHVK